MEFTVFKKIKFILKMKGFLKLDSIEDNISYLLLNYNKINLYDSGILRYINSIEKDISIYNQTLNAIVSQDLNTKLVIANDVTERTIYKQDIKQWYTNDEYILTNNNELEYFLKHSLVLTKWFEMNEKNTNSIILYNIRRLRPYYLNIKDIISILHSILETK